MCIVIGVTEDPPIADITPGASRPTPIRFEPMPVWECIRCPGEPSRWTGRTSEAPKHCPRCRATRWWLPRPGKVGRPERYPIGQMEVGDVVVLPWAPMLEHNVVDVETNNLMDRAVRAHAKRHGKEFRTEGVSDGLRVERTA